MEHCLNYTDGKPEVLLFKKPISNHSATFSTTHLALTGPDSGPGLCGERLATDLSVRSMAQRLKAICKKSSAKENFCPSLPDIRQSVALFGGSEESPGCFCDKECF